MSSHHGLAPSLILTLALVVSSRFVEPLSSTISTQQSLSVQLIGKPIIQKVSISSSKSSLTLSTRMAEYSDHIRGSNPSRSSNRMDEYNEEIKERIEAADLFVQSSGYKVEQQNGQRVTMIDLEKMPMKLYMKLPDETENNEVFFGKIPRDLYEDELLPFLSRAGRVYKIRLMMDFGFTNRGFGFARYFTEAEADLACSMLHSVRLRMDEPTITGVVKSFDNKRLYLGNLPNMSESELFKQCSTLLMDVESVQLSEPNPTAPDKRYAIVEFKNHSAATQARRILIPGGATIGNRVVTVDWAKTRNDENQSPPLSRPSEDKFFNNPRRTYQDKPKKLHQYQRNKSLFPPIKESSKAPVSYNNITHCLDFTDNTVVINNININSIPLDKIKQLFQIAGPISKMYRSGENSLTILYEKPEYAVLMLDMLSLYPACFSHMAIVNHILIGNRLQAL